MGYLWENDSSHKLYNCRQWKINWIIFNIVRSKFLIEASGNDLELATEKLNIVYGGFDKEQVVLEDKWFQQYVRATNATSDAAFKWTAREVIQFTVKLDFTESNYIESYSIC